MLPPEPKKVNQALCFSLSNESLNAIICLLLWIVKSLVCPSLLNPSKVN